MRLLVQGLVAVLIGLPVGSALAAPDLSCRPKAIASLRAASPGGFAVYAQAGGGDSFRNWIDCGASQYDLPTAVHESTHFIAGETDAFPLVGGGAVRRPHEVSDFFPPYRIADRFSPDDFTAIYLSRGKASSSTDFLYLLDEFNAYSHDLDAAVDLRFLSTPDTAVDHRDGLAAMMAFLAAYADMARTSEPETWSGLQRPEVAATIGTLWTRAERVMARSCGIPNFGTSDRSYIGQVCAAGDRSALAQILGRAPACPAACLEATPEQEIPGDDDVTASTPSRAPQSADTDIESDDPMATERPRHPFAGNVGPRRHRIRGEDE